MIFTLGHLDITFQTKAHGKYRIQLEVRIAILGFTSLDGRILNRTSLRESTPLHFT
jgi:hypothetical protein